MKRIISYLLVVAMLVISMSAFTACSSKNSPSEPGKPTTEATATPAASSDGSQGSVNTEVSGEVLFYHHWTDLNSTVLPEYVKEFNKTYPNVKIILETSNDYNATLKIKLAANDVPDVFEPDSNSMDVMAQKALPLNDLSITSDFVGANKYTGADGNVYGLPQGLNTYGVIYNKKIFKELGISIPTKLDDFIAAAKKINDAGKGYIGLASAAKAKWPLQYYWQSVPMQLTGDADVLNKLASSDKPFTADNAVVQSYSILKTLTDNKVFEADPLSADWEPMKTEFRSGKVGMFFLGNWFIPQAIGDVLTIEDVGFFPFPYDNNGGKNVVVEADCGWAISKTSKNPEATKAWFMFLADTKCADFAKTNGFLSPRTSITVDSSVMNEFNSYNPNKIVANPQSQDLQAIISKMQFDYSAIAQNIVAGNDITKEFDDVNTKWAKSRVK